LEAKNLEKSLLESLQDVSDTSAKSFVESESIKTLGVLEAVETLRSSSISQHPRVKIMLENYRNVLVNKGVPEYSVIGNFVNSLKEVEWDSKVKSIVENLSSKCEKYVREIEVSKVLDSIKASGQRKFYSDLYESLNQWMVSESKSSHLLVNDIKKYSFNPSVRNLINFLEVYENNSDSSRLSIPNVNNVESFVERNYSPISIKENKVAFFLGNSFFEGDQEGVKRISFNESLERHGELFVKLASICNKPNVRVDENGVNFSLGRKSFRISEGADSPHVYSGKKRIKFTSVNEMAKLVGLEVSSVAGYNDMSLVGDVVTVYENFGRIVELDFSKSVVSKIYEGLQINLFKWNNQIYLQKINNAMNENSVYPVTSIQAVKMVKEALRYDISEGLTEFLEGELRTKSILLNERDTVLESISKVEAGIEKVNQALTAPGMSKSAELLEAKKILERELKVLRNKWSAINEEIDSLETLYTSDFLAETEKFNIGDIVKIKESGDTGKIISIDGASGRYTVLTDAGKTGDFKIDEIADLESALNAAEEENKDSSEADFEEGGEESDFDSAEEVKESSMSEAPTKKKGSVEKQSQPNMVKAPEESSDAPMAHDLKNPKAANLAEAPKGQKNTEFKTKDADMGYNLDESDMPAGKNPQELSTAPGPSYERVHNGKSLKDLKGKQNLADAPGSRGRIILTFDGYHGYNIDESKGDIKDNPMMAKAPEGTKSGPMAHDLKNPEQMNLASAPGSKKGEVDYEVNDEMGYNLEESELLKKK